MQCIWIPGRLPTYTELLAAALSNRHAYAKLKETSEDKVEACALQQGMPKVGKGAYFTYLLIEENRRRDPSNVVSGAIKVIEDALRRKRRFLENDGWEWVAGIATHIKLADELEHAPGSFLTIGYERCRSLPTTLVHLYSHTRDRK